MHPFQAFLELRAADPKAAAVIQGDQVITRDALAARAGQLAAGLGEHGIVPRAGQGELPRVMIHLSNSPDMVALVLAIWSQGGLPMFLSSKVPQSHLEGVAARLAPRLIVNSDVLAGLARVGGGLGPARPEGGDDGSVVFTSGSTGLPKGVVQKGKTLVSGVQRVASTLGYGPNERILVPIPFAHDYGWGQMLSGLVGGHALILPERDILVDIGKAVSAHCPTVFAGVPSLYAALLFGISGFETARTESLGILTSTGSAFSDEVYDALVKRIPQARIMRNYGLTETYRGCCRLPEHTVSASDSIGKPINGVAIKIMDPEGKPVKAGQEGEIVHCGEGVFDRYLDDPEATAKARRLVDGAPAVFTGDIGVMDDQGFVTLLGRRDRLVKSMDVRINLNDVEREIAALDEVAEVAVVATPHPHSGVAITAYVVAQSLGPAPSGKVIQRRINRSLPAHMRPRHVEILGALPRTPVGKVDYISLSKREL